MSTPVKHDYKQAPRHVRMPTEELKQQMLFMVSLQNEQQRQCSASIQNQNNNNDDNDDQNEEYRTLLMPGSHLLATTSQSPTPFPTLKATSSSSLLLRGTPPRVPPTAAPPTIQAPSSSITDKEFFMDPTVGTGTMTLNFVPQQQEHSETPVDSPTLYQPVTSGPLSPAVQTQEDASHSQPTPVLDPPHHGETKSLTLQPTLKSISTYGTLPLAPATPESTGPSSHLAGPAAGWRTSREPLADTRMTSEPHRPPPTQTLPLHQGSHVGGTAGPYAPTPTLPTPLPPTTTSYQRRQNKPSPLHSVPVSSHYSSARSLLSFLGSCCGGRSARRQRHSIHVASQTDAGCWPHGSGCLDSDVFLRSFCYGAIDGLLTASSILGAFYGLQLLPLFVSANNSMTAASAKQLGSTTLLLCGLSASACLADALCMGLGHVWTVQGLAETQARERMSAKRSLLQHRADAKGQLVDLLLQKGMLKIDAMSVADTLEGYPDLFVSALLGDALAGSPDGDPSAGSSARRPSDRNSEGYADELEYTQGQDSTGEPPSVLYVPAAAGGGAGRPHHDAMVRMMDPLHHAVQSATTEARREAICMMLGFATFSLLPSLAVHFLTLLSVDHAPNSVSHGADTNDNFSLWHHPNILSVAVIATVMWLLGVWKSRFVDSNWIVYGIETIVVWLLCIACAYLVGSLLRATVFSSGFSLQMVPLTLSQPHTVKPKVL